SWTSTSAKDLAITETGVTVTGLSPGTKYYFRLYISDGVYGGDSKSVTATTDTIAVSNLKSTVKSDSRITLIWTAPKKATAVQVQRSTDGTTWTSTSVTKTLETTTLTGLTPNTTYYIRLNVTGGENAGPSNVITVKTDTQAVPSLSLYSSTTSSLTLRWSQATKAEAVRIEQWDGGQWVSAVTGVINPTATSATVTGLQSGTRYTFRIVVEGGYKEGVSEEFTFITK
ncbi:fibronectin type III domain-containing protein, partial [Cohnella sp. AR92]|uniref:fibronectin type III domain-containing protein n=1 Tax=Cohnella sp. AR92 TaxID=648716 RepID=UPI000FB908CE